jgi:putative redox protein
MYIKVKALDERFKLADAGGRTVILDPKQEGGFRPTELWLAGLSGCAYGTLVKAAKDRGYALDSLVVEAAEETDERGDISAALFTVTFEGALSAGQKEELLAYVAANCKVVRTAHDRISIRFVESGSSVSSLPDSEAEGHCEEESGACCI